MIIETFISVNAILLSLLLTLLLFNELENFLEVGKMLL